MKLITAIIKPFTVADEAHYVRRYHFDDTRGLLAKNDPEGARLLNSRFQEMWKISFSRSSFLPPFCISANDLRTTSGATCFTTM